MQAAGQGWGGVQAVGSLRWSLWAYQLGVVWLAMMKGRTLYLIPIMQGIAKQLVRALHYLHSNRIIHR